VYAPFYSSSLSPAQVRPSDGTTAAASLTNITRTGPGNPPGPLLSGVPQTISYTWDLTALSFDWDTYSHYDFGGIQLCSNGTSIPAGTVIYFDDISVSYTLSSARSMGPAFRHWLGTGPGPVERVAVADDYGLIGRWSSWWPGSPVAWDHPGCGG
jgi:hypothetical protein